MKISTVRVAAISGPKEVECYPHGRFAVHLSSYDALSQAERDSCYAITHIATGRLVAVKCGRPEARRLAKALDAALELDITEEDVKNESKHWRTFKKVAIVLIDQARAIP
jgi:hypothetical protein